MTSKLFIIGSGFTNATTCGAAPLNKDVMRLIHQTEPATWDDLAARYTTEDIEVALTKLDLDIMGTSRNTELVVLRRKVDSSLSDFFRQFRYNEEMLKKSPWLLDFVQGAFANDDTAVSLNYDCLLEGLLDRCKLWSPHEGYGRTRPVKSVPAELNPSPVTVLKIHGSENFHRNAVPGSQTEKGFSFTTDESIFPVSGEGRFFCHPGKDSEEAIIAPSFVKVFPSALLCLMQEALHAAVKAKTLVLIGCGLRREDTFLYLLLWHFLEGSKRIFILDPYASDLSKRISSTLEYDISRLVYPIDKSLQGGWCCLTSELKRL
ncbi:MAG: hypothetical protein JXD19_07765 [Deltaproteobacteria bacterium]|nr:hypothetical protein [Deltaproteobacteria bacterium]